MNASLSQLSLHPPTQFLCHLLPLLAHSALQSLFQKQQSFLVVTHLPIQLFIGHFNEIRVEAVTIDSSFVNDAVLYVVGDFCHTPVEFLVDAVLEFGALTVKPIPTSQTLVIIVYYWVLPSQLLALKDLFLYWATVVCLKCNLQLSAEDLMSQRRKLLCEVHHSTYD